MTPELTTQDLATLQRLVLAEYEANEVLLGRLSGEHHTRVRAYVRHLSELLTVLTDASGTDTGEEA